MKQVLAMGLFFVAHYRFLYKRLITSLKIENPNMKIFVYVADDTQKRYVEENFDTDFIEEVIFYHRFANDFDTFKHLSEDEKTQEIISFEATHNLSANSLLVMDRHFGRGYSPAGYYHAKSDRGMKNSYVDAVYSHINCVNFFSNEIVDRGINLFIGGSYHAVVACKSNYIPFRNLVSARYENRYFWTSDQYWSNPFLKNEFEKLRGEEVQTDVSLERYHESKVYRANKLAKQDSVNWLVKVIVVILLRRARNLFRSGRKSGQYLLIEELKFVVRRYFGRKKLKLNKFCRPLDDKPNEFVYYPLQTEPEATLQVFSPEFFFQHTLVVMLSKAVPFNVRIFLKETFLAAGRRPKNFYEQLTDLLNVSFLDMRVEGIDVIKKAKIVATISGTAGIEAAILGKPILNFGRHNCFDFLDHSINVSSFCEIESQIQKALSVDEVKSKIDGKKFRQALINSTIDMKSYSSVSPENISDDVINDCLTLLKRGFHN